MRFLASTLLAAALALPAVAQPGRGGGGSGPAPEIEKLREQVAALEKKLNAVLDAQKKTDDRKPEAKKPEPRTEEGRRDERGPGGRLEGRPMGFGGRGGEGGAAAFGGGGFGGMMGGAGGMMRFPIERLSPDEQATFKKLVEKMSNRPAEAERKPDAAKAPEGKPNPFKGGDAPKDAAKTAAKPSPVEERLDRLEKLVQELVRNSRR